MLNQPKTTWRRCRLLLASDLNALCTGSFQIESSTACVSPSLSLLLRVVVQLRPDMPFSDINDMMFSHTMLFSAQRRCHLWEIFSHPRVAPVMRALGGRALRSVDLVNCFDLTNGDVQHCLLSDVCSQQPFFLMLSPPCTLLCKYMYCNWAKMDALTKYARLQEALGHIDLSCWLADMQSRCGRYYCIENPEGSQAWNRNNATCKHTS